MKFIEDDHSSPVIVWRADHASLNPDLPDGARRWSGPPLILRTVLNARDIISIFRTFDQPEPTDQTAVQTRLSPAAVDPVEPVALMRTNTGTGDRLLAPRKGRFMDLNRNGAATLSRPIASLQVDGPDRLLAVLVKLDAVVAALDLLHRLEGVQIAVATTLCQRKASPETEQDRRQDQLLHDFILSI